MKSIHNSFLTKETKQKLPKIGESFHPSIRYTKDDYLTPGKVAEKFGISIDQAKNIMKDLIFKRASFALNGHRAQMVVRLGKSDGRRTYLHPMALDAFQQHIGNQKD